MTGIIKISQVLHVISFIIFNIRSDIISDNSQSLVAGAAPMDSNSLSMCLTHQEMFHYHVQSHHKDATMPVCWCFICLKRCEYE